MGKRGTKICPSCGRGTGPRSFKCPNTDCNHQYIIQKGVNNFMDGEDVDWKTLEKKDYIKVVAGSGPYMELEKPNSVGDFQENMGYYGLFQIHKVFKDGLLCYPKNKSESGACFIYMGPEKACRTGVTRVPHKIRKVNSKYIKQE